MRAATRIVMPEVTGIPVGRGFAALLRRSAPLCNCARAAIALAGALNNPFGNFGLKPPDSACA